MCDERKAFTTKLTRGCLLARTRCAVVWYASLLLVLAGCAVFPPREEIPLKQASLEELTQLLRQRESAIQTMKGLFSAKVRGGLIPIASRVEGTVYYRRPNAIRLRGFSAVGSELFEFVQADDQYKLRLPTMGRVLSGRPSEMDHMGKLTRPFQLSVWAISGVLGTGAIGKQETAKLVEDGNRYRLDVTGPAGHLARRIWFDRRDLLVVREERIGPSGEVEAIMQFEDYRPVGEPAVLTAAQGMKEGDTPLLRPFKISLEDGQGQGSVQMTFHELIPNEQLKPGDLGQV